MLDCPHLFQIAVFAEFDPLPDRNGFRYSRSAINSPTQSREVSG
jgi:hypothetical protein